METEEEGEVKDLDLSLPGRDALGLGLCDLRRYSSKHCKMVA